MFFNLNLVRCLHLEMNSDRLFRSVRWSACKMASFSSFIKRLRWKAFFLDTNDESAEYNNKTFGFKSEATPPQHDGLKYFEQDLYDMIRRIQFRPVKSSFQSQLLADVKTIRNSTNVIVQADKTINLYRMSVAEYSKLLNDNIAAKYKITSADTVSDINNEAKTIARKLQLVSRIERFSDKNAFVTIKDHK